MLQAEPTNHQKFALMCALAAACELSESEQCEFNRHLTGCELCRQELIGCRDALDRVAGDTLTDLPTLEMSSHSKQFTKFAKSHGLEFSGPALRSLGARDWWHGWFALAPVQWAAACVALGVVTLGTFLFISRPLTPVVLQVARPSAPIILQTTTPQLAQSQAAPIDAQPGDQRAALDDLQNRLLVEQRTQFDLQSQIFGRDEEIAQLKSAAADSDRQLSAAQSTISMLTSKNDELTASLVAERAQQSDLLGQLHEEKVKGEQDRQLTTVSTDVRELMGARRLYMIDVYDGEDTSRANRSFGRVFYTEGKSLIFYAFDLDKVKSGKRVTFAAWGERGKNSGTVKPLGVFNLDDANQKRWVMKVNNPEKLKSIDAIFVTVENKPGSDRPTGQKLLYAYLGGQPNHP